MISINWKKFEIKNLKATEAFETLCYFLFCRKFNLTEGIRTDFNQVGLETVHRTLPLFIPWNENVKVELKRRLESSDE